MSRSSKRQMWTQKETDFLTKNYGRLTAQEMRDRYMPTRSVNSIAKKIQHLGLNKIEAQTDLNIRFKDFKYKKPGDVEALFEAMVVFQDASLRLSDRMEDFEAEVQTSKPIIVAFLADAHVGALSGKYRRLNDRINLIRDTERCYLFSVGDTIDNYLPKGSHNQGMLGTLIPPALQKDIVEMLYGKLKGKWLGVVQGCFLEGTPIVMANGIEKPIENIKAGDHVISDGSEQKVVRTYVNYWNGLLVKLNVMGIQNIITATSNHKIYARRRLKREYLKEHPYPNRKLSSRVRGSEPIWLEAGELNVGDFVAFPRITGEITPKFTEEEMNVFGWWLAEGSFNLNATIFSFGEKDELDAQRIESHFKLMNVSTHMNKNDEKHTISLAVKSWETTNMFRSMFGEYCDGKYMPKEFLYYPKGHQMALLNGLFGGDGHERNNSGMETAWTTTSHMLQSQVRQILFRLGHFVSTSYYERNGKKPWWVLTFRHSPSRPRHLVDNEYIWAPVKDVQSYLYDGVVHNIEVENTHTYEVCGMKSLNCHDEWSHDTDDFDWSAYLAEHLGCPNMGFGGFCDLTVGTVEYRIGLRHKYRYNSSFNLTHVVKRMREQDGDFDIGCVAHHHQADMEHLAMNDKDRVFIRPGSFKGVDRYSRQLGFRDTGEQIPCVVLDPAVRKVTPFLNLEDGVRFLKTYD